MGGSPWIATLVAAPPAEPHEHAGVARHGAMSELALQAYADARVDWSCARSVFAGVQRQARSLSSSKRRFLMDALSFLVRRERTISLLLTEAGLSEDAGRARVERARYLATLVLMGGLRPSDVEWQGPAVDWDLVADPHHCLEGWLRRTSPSPESQLGQLGSLPHWLAKRLVAAPEPAELVAALNRRGPLCLRANRPFATRDGLVEELDGARPCRLSAEGLQLAAHADARSLPALAEGRADIQDEGSQLIVELAAPQEGERVIDACAGAMGKSLALASWQEDKGRILATDPRKDALRRGLRRARRAGYRSIRTCPPQAVRGPADLVLVDAPCTGTGALRRRPWTRWSAHVADLQRLPREQGEILERAASWVAPEGRLVYATCSLLREENDEVVDRFLAAHPDWQLLPSGEVLGAQRADEIGDSGVLRLYPHRHDTDGFYAAVLTRS